MSRHLAASVHAFGVKKEKNRQRFLLIKVPVGFKSTGKKAKLTHVYAKISWTAVSLSSSSTTSVCFLLEVHRLGSGVQAGATNRRPTTAEKK